MRTLLPMLILAATATAAEPLDVFKPLIGGQWVSAAKLPNGEQVRMRTVWTWGAASKLVRMRQFVLGREGEVQRFETIVFHDPAARALAYRVYSAAGLLSGGSGRSTEQGVALEQEKTETFPAMRTVYQLEENGMCVSRVYFKGEADWQLRVQSRMLNEELQTYKQLELEKEKTVLQALSQRVGRWQFEPGASIETGSWSLHERLLRVVAQADGAPASETYVSFEPRTKKLVAIRIGVDGAVREGTVGKDKSVVTWTWAEGKERVRDTLEGDTKIHRVVEVRDGDGWRAVREQKGSKQ